VTAVEKNPDWKPNWTTHPETRRENSSKLFTSLVEEVSRLIQEGGGWALDENWVKMKAGLIMAQLAHVHRLSPPGWPREEAE